jgi:hypothetical protein
MNAAWAVKPLPALRRNTHPAFGEVHSTLLLASVCDLSVHVGASRGRFAGRAGWGRAEQTPTLHDALIRVGLRTVVEPSSRRTMSSR